MFRWTEFPDSRTPSRHAELCSQLASSPLHLFIHYNVSHATCTDKNTVDGYFNNELSSS